MAYSSFPKPMTPQSHTLERSRQSIAQHRPAGIRRHPGTLRTHSLPMGPGNRSVQGAKEVVPADWCRRLPKDDCWRRGLLSRMQFRAGHF